MYHVTFAAYCGMSYRAEENCERGDARAAAARILRRRRRSGHPVAVLTRGLRWEIGEPDGCVMVPDTAGILAIRRDVFECRECGSGHETRDEAAECCADRDAWPCPECGALHDCDAAAAECCAE